jgi:hypothetical protein
MVGPLAGTGYGLPFFSEAYLHDVKKKSLVPLDVAGEFDISNLDHGIIAVVTRKLGRHFREVRVLDFRRVRGVIGKGPMERIGKSKVEN